MLSSGSPRLAQPRGADILCTMYAPAAFRLRPLAFFKGRTTTSRRVGTQREPSTVSSCPRGITLLCTLVGTFRLSKNPRPNWQPPRLRPIGAQCTKLAEIATIPFRYTAVPAETTAPNRAIAVCGKLDRGSPYFNSSKRSLDASSLPVDPVLGDGSLLSIRMRVASLSQVRAARLSQAQTTGITTLTISQRQRR